MNVHAAQTVRPATAPPILWGEHGAVIFDDLSRIVWTRLSSAQWQLLDIWPTPPQRAEVLKRARDGATVVVLVKGRPESESAFLDEIPRHLAIRASDIGEGLVEITVRPGDWLPRTVRSRLDGFIQAENARRQHAPQLLRAPASIFHDRRTNLFFLYVCSAFTRDALAPQLEELVASLVSQKSARTRKATLRPEGSMK
ncbi:hypothetical protein [Microbacterium sp. SORGH_AS_0888]|uniref:hypothetical protein n=1 Tax=Microbacterium sp. SORGH_AS_0888 TaxID=3041791 RepID=UPI0027869506|nr:hypothetical protein [Microbacterium sp. SORGH_AS_0888]MDQ1131044.1 antitoxin (DNA-binding transcriptional repressor) of toxin-antitoxin stability system [Microbacterium sp. SORGH_AS_0888]